MTQHPFLVPVGTSNYSLAHVIAMQYTIILAVPNGKSMQHYAQ